MTTIDWFAFLRVFLASLIAAAVIVSLFAGGIRLVSSPPRGTPGTGTRRDDELDEVPRTVRSRAATVAGGVLFALAAIVAVVGVLLLVLR